MKEAGIQNEKNHLYSGFFYDLKSYDDMVYNHMSVPAN